MWSVFIYLPHYPLYPIKYLLPTNPNLFRPLSHYFTQGKKCALPSTVRLPICCLQKKNETLCTLPPFFTRQSGTTSAQGKKDK